MDRTVAINLHTQYHLLELARALRDLYLPIFHLSGTYTYPSIHPSAHLLTDLPACLGLTVRGRKTQRGTDDREGFGYGFL